MIDQQIQKQLRQKYNPDGSPLRLHQLKLLEMLMYFDKLCTDNGIQYWLSSGTCLGAVRHGGFIPWDDDLDVEMMREDYLKLEKVFKDTDDYIIQSWKNDPFYSTSFAKLRDKHTAVYDSLYKYRGCFIDIFALEYTNRSIAFFCSYLHKFFSGKLYDWLKAMNNKKNTLSRFAFTVVALFFMLIKNTYFLCVPLFRFVGYVFPQKKLRHQYGVGWLNNVRSIDDIFPIKRVCFENVMLPIPGNADNYLRSIYGDYMQLPKDEKIPRPHAQYFKYVK